MAFISEINFRGQGVAQNGEFIEIALGPNDDPADFVVSVYRNDGTLHTGADIPGGEVNLSTLTGTPDPENPKVTIYVIPVGVRNANSDGNEGSGIALTDISPGGGVISFPGSFAIGSFTATEGAAAGASTDPILNHRELDPGESIQWDINGNEYIGPISNGNAVLCVTAHTRIKTPRGEVCAKDLTVGDLVWTLDHGPQPIRWIGTRSLSAADLTKGPKKRPIRIAKNALGDNVPARDLTVSPQHRILGRNKVAERMFDTSDVLVPAVKLTEMEGIDVVDPTEGAEPVDYFHILFDHHELILADGALIESLLIAENSTHLIDDYEATTKAKGFELKQLAQTPARLILSGKLSKKIVARLIKNSRAFFDGGIEVDLVPEAAAA